ncbi:hypothetical protein [Myceligenerans xiligouense]|uniref:hypothetical protein n=1 Tax=Myceligenerans xiligouense TaxID=253184 RepID=UPI000F50C1E9|nr:hypothetical protein [Myceligenerans xiligouense]
MGYSGLFDGPLASIVWICAILLAAGALFIVAWIPIYWHGGDGWFAGRIEGALGSLSKYPSGAHSLVPFAFSACGFAIATLFTAFMTVGGFGEDDDHLIPGMLVGVAVWIIGAGFQQSIIWFNRPKFLVPPRWRDDPGEWELRQRRRARQKSRGREG